MLDSSEWTIYRWTNHSDKNKMYHGQDKSGHRIEDHIWCAEHGCPSKDEWGCGASSDLHKAIRAHGLESFSVEIVETGFSTIDEINKVEDSYIQTSLASDGTGYNKRTNEHSQGGTGVIPKERYEMILDYLVPSRDMGEEGFQIIKIRGISRDIPEWMMSDREVSKLLLRSFPTLGINLSQRKRAGRWARVIHLHYRMKLPRQIVAEEMNISQATLESLTRSITRASKGLRANGSGKRREVS